MHPIECNRLDMLASQPTHRVSSRTHAICAVHAECPSLAHLGTAGAKLNKEKMHDAVRRMEGKNASGKKQYSIRMVSQEVSDALSGFPHNAVTPIGMVKEVPVLLSDKIKTLPEGKLWLGGGEPDLKLRIDVAEFASKFVSAGQPPVFADITE